MAKKMQKWTLCGTVPVDVYVTVVAESLDEAIAMAEDEVGMTEYCNGTVGVDYWSSDAISDGDTNCSCEIEWIADYCELEEEWEEEDEDEDEEDE